LLTVQTPHSHPSIILPIPN